MKNSSQRIDTLPSCVQSFKAIGDETRLRIVGLLQHGELCVCDIMEVLALPQSTASRHLAYLKKSGWVIGRRQGRWMYYQLCHGLEAESLHTGIVDYISGLSAIREDRKKLQTYLENKNASSTGKCG